MNIEVVNDGETERESTKAVQLGTKRVKSVGSCNCKPLTIGMHDQYRSPSMVLNRKLVHKCTRVH